MLGVLYIIFTFTVGYSVLEFLFPRLYTFTNHSYEGKRIALSPLFMLIPGSFVTGTFLMVWLTYLLAYILSPITATSMRSPLLISNAIVMLLALILSTFTIVRQIKQGRIKKLYHYLQMLKLNDIIFLILATAFSLLLMYYTFYVKKGNLYVGLSVFSDFAPHLGMIRSFSYGNNFPTEYAHFAGEDIRYHFLFQFFVGNLEYLGLRLDHAFNIPSAISFLCVLCMLYTLAMKLSAKKLVGYLSVFFFLFRSSNALFDYLKSLPKDANIVQSLIKNFEFIGTTPNENWGLWNLNVYCNQRHLAIGLTMLLFLVTLYLEYVYRARKRIYANSSDSIMNALFAKEAWLFHSIRFPIYAGVLLALGSFINGACVIACLTVLFFIALISDHKFEFLTTAILAVLGCVLASKFFINGSATEAKYFFGFIAENKTVFGVIDYIMTLCGILPYVLLAAFTLVDERKKWIMIAFAGPFAVAFTLSLTVDVTVNHKYIMISLMLLGIFAAIFVDWLYHHKGAFVKFVSICLILLLTCTGLYDFTTVLKKNVSKNNIRYSLSDPISQWVHENSDSHDIYLTSMVSINSVLLGGAMLYYGWPYYAWSAGYDTYTRDTLVRKMYGATSKEELTTLIEQEEIRFIVIDYEVRTSNDYAVNESLIDSTYECVFDNGEQTGNNEWTTKIYDTQKKK